MIFGDAFCIGSLNHLSYNKGKFENINIRKLVIFFYKVRNIYLVINTHK